MRGLSSKRWRKRVGEVGDNLTMSVVFAASPAMALFIFTGRDYQVGEFLDLFGDEEATVEGSWIWNSWSVLLFIWNRLTGSVVFLAIWLGVLTWLALFTADEYFKRGTFQVASLLLGFGIAFLIVSWRASDGSWWESLWLEVGGALLIGAIVDFVWEIRDLATSESDSGAPT